MAQVIEFFSNHPYLLAGLVGALAFVIVAEVRHRIGPSGLSTADVVRLINDEDAVVIDIRESGEYKSGHIINAKNLPMARLLDEIGRVAKNKSKPVILYCKTGSQSAAACQSLVKAGYEKAAYIKSGLYSWQDSNLPTEK